VIVARGTFLDAWQAALLAAAAPAGLRRRDAELG
jgi:hypothetical protein